jgi:catabolite regulation protein CreA
MREDKLVKKENRSSGKCLHKSDLTLLHKKQNIHRLMDRLRSQLAHIN